MRPSSVVVVGVCLVGDRCLMALRSRHDPHMPGRWSFPGGHVRADESLVDALKREVLEETGLALDRSVLVGTSTYNETTDSGLQPVVQLNYLIGVDGSVTPAPRTTEMERAEWIELEKMDEIETDDFTKRILRQAKDWLNDSSRKDGEADTPSRTRLSQLLGLDDNAEEPCLRKVSDHFHSRRREINELLKNLLVDSAMPSQIIHQSREVATHYKWLLARDSHDNSKIWLHQYKVASHKQLSYADIPHNHRYDFTSMIVAGGYQNIAYQLTAEAELKQIEDSLHTVGDVLSMSHSEIHSLTEIQPGTVSLFVQGPIQRENSESFDVQGLLQTHPSMETMYDNLRSIISQTRDLAD